MQDAHEGTITVAVTTYRRPQQLADGLSELVRQTRDSRHNVSILVIDNDSVASASAFVRGLGADIRYVHEPRPGVSAARNAALVAAHGSDAVIFLDDDTVPLSGWLDALIDFWAAQRPAAVTGSVQFTFDSDADARRGRAWGEFEDTDLPSGTGCPSAASRNLLLDLDFLDENRLRFDESLGLIGGEDTLLTRQLVAAGGTILWCQEARVSESVPPDRARARWILRRAFRSGGSWANAMIHTSGGDPSRVRRRLASRALAIIPLRTASAGLALLRGRSSAARRAWRDATAQAGALRICLGGGGTPEYARGTR